MVSCLLGSRSELGFASLTPTYEFIPGCRTANVGWGERRESQQNSGIRSHVAVSQQRMNSNPGGHFGIIGCRRRIGIAPAAKALIFMARLGGFEPPTRGLEVRCSVLLSYRRPVVGKGDASYENNACPTLRKARAVSIALPGKALGMAPALSFPENGPRATPERISVMPAKAAAHDLQDVMDSPLRGSDVSRSSRTSFPELESLRRENFPSRVRKGPGGALFLCQPGRKSVNLAEKSDREATVLKGQRHRKVFGEDGS